MDLDFRRQTIRGLVHAPWFALAVLFLFER